jgi:putative spermidine/putrescine transport system ATP-binding protein
LAHALAVEQVTRRFGDVAALDGISLHVERGEFLTLLGPSGCGKTTLLMTIAGFAAPDAGRILLDGAPIDHLPPERRNLGMVFQGYALFPHLTVAENVAFPLRVRGRPRREIGTRTRQMLETVQLDGLADRYPRQLSGGQQQRAALARALVFEPSLVLLDEPLSALDKNLRTDLQLELKDLHRRVGVTFIYVTHDQQEAMSMSDRIVILRQGRVVQEGTPAALYETPATRFVAGFLGRSNFLSGRVECAVADGFAYRTGGARLLQKGAARAAGESVLIALRPEKIRIGDDAPGANRLSGRVVSCTYHGEYCAVVAEVPEIGRIGISASAWKFRAPAPGETILFGWDADAAVPVTDD